MSYEHCEKHNQDATNGCPECAAKSDFIDAVLGPMACGVPLTDIATCTKPAGHEGHHHAHGHSFAPQLPYEEEVPEHAPRGLGGLPRITNMVAAYPEMRQVESRDGLATEVYVDVAAGFVASDFVAVVHDHELRALGQLALTAQEEATQRAGAVRHLEATRAELVKVTAERDAVQALENESLRCNAELRSEVARLQALGGAQITGVAAAGVSFINAALDRAASQQGQRRRLPAERKAVTHAFAIHTADGRHKGYVTVGLYDDGTVGEVFLKLDQQGSQVSGFCDAWSIAVSMLLQTGTSLEVVCRKFRSMRFEPSGRTETPGIRVADSPVDYAARYLEHRFVRGLQLTDEAPAGAPEGEV